MNQLSKEEVTLNAWQKWRRRIMQSAFDYSGKTVTLDGQDYDVPPFSTFEEKCRCGDCRVAYFPDIKAYFLNQWECNFMYPMVVVVLSLLAYAFGIWSLFYTTKGALTWALVALGTFIYAVWWVAYLQAMCRSAGYLPWFWFIEKRTKYTYEEKMGGIITNKAQSDFCNMLDRPERAILSAKARRIVLRADHICPWIGNWVGLKNYRFFFTQLIWFILLFIFFFTVLILEVVDMSTQGWRTTVPRIALFVLVIPVILFFIFFLIVFKRHIRYLFTNNTTVHELKSERTNDFTNPYDLGCWRNCVETIGPANWCPCWFFPIPIPRINDGFNWTRNDIDYGNQNDDIESDDVEGQSPIVSHSGDPFKVDQKSESSSSLPYQESSSLEIQFSSVDGGNESSDEHSGFNVPPPMPSSKPKDFAMLGSNKEIDLREEPKGIAMAPPIPPPMFSDFDASLSDSPIPPPTHDTLIDILIDKTIDGEDDQEFDAYLTGQKLPPLPPSQPVALLIKDTNPDLPSKPRHSQSKKSLGNIPKRTDSFDVDSPRKGARVHVKKVRVPIVENGVTTDKFAIRKIKVVEDKHVSSHNLSNSKREKKSGSKLILQPPPLPPVQSSLETPRLEPPIFHKTVNVQPKEEEIRFYLPPK